MAVQEVVQNQQPLNASKSRRDEGRAAFLPSELHAGIWLINSGIHRRLVAAESSEVYDYVARSMGGHVHCVRPARWGWAGQGKAWVTVLVVLLLLLFFLFLLVSGAG